MSQKIIVNLPGVSNRSVVLAVSTALVLLAGTTLPADMVTIGDSKDTTIFQNGVNNSSGGGNGLFAGTNGADSPRRALIEFNVAGSLPPGAIVDSVQLTLVLGQVAGSGGGGNTSTSSSTVDLHKLSANWGEGVAQATNPPTDSIGGSGQGAAANPGDATWNANFFGASTWANPGGDFSATVSASQTISSTTGVAYTWGSTSQLVSDVQGWLDSPATNFGWELVNADETTATDFRAFFSKETLTTANHPALQIVYSVPEPSALATMLIGAITLWGASRKCRRCKLA